MPSGNSNNTAKGKEFQELACAAVSEFFGSQFHLNVPMPIGDPPKNHKFDLVSAGCRHAGKCKCYTWTESQNTPSAKMGHVNEAVFYLSFLPSDITRFVIMKRESYPKTHETLAEYYCRTYRHFLNGVLILELDVDSRKVRRIT